MVTLLVGDSASLLVVIAELDPFYSPDNDINDKEVRLHYLFDKFTYPTRNTVLCFCLELYFHVLFEQSPRVHQ